MAVEKPLLVMGGVIKSPPFSTDGRREAGYLLRMLQLGESIGMPQRLSRSILRTCQRRLAAYRAILGDEEGS